MTEKTHPARRISTRRYDDRQQNRKLNIVRDNLNQKDELLKQRSCDLKEAHQTLHESEQGVVILEKVRDRHIHMVGEWRRQKALIELQRDEAQQALADYKVNKAKHFMIENGSLTMGTDVDMVNHIEHLVDRINELKTDRDNFRGNFIHFKGKCEKAETDIHRYKTTAEMCIKRNEVSWKGPDGGVWTGTPNECVEYLESFIKEMQDKDEDLMGRRAQIAAQAGVLNRKDERIKVIEKGLWSHLETIRKMESDHYSYKTTADTCMDANDRRIQQLNKQLSIKSRDINDIGNRLCDALKEKDAEKKTAMDLSLRIHSKRLKVDNLEEKIVRLEAKLVELTRYTDENHRSLSSRYTQLNIRKGELEAEVEQLRQAKDEQRRKLKERLSAAEKGTARKSEKLKAERLKNQRLCREVDSLAHRLVVSGHGDGLRGFNWSQHTMDGKTERGHNPLPKKERKSIDGIPVQKKKKERIIDPDEYLKDEDPVRSMIRRVTKEINEIINIDLTDDKGKDTLSS